MQVQVRHNQLPDLDRLSFLAAVIMLAYALARLVDLPERVFNLQLPGIFLAPRINTTTLVSLLVAALTITGAQWLLQDHPAMQNKSRLEHWLLPGLTAWVIEIPLSQLPLNPIWWIGFALGGALIILVLVAEYIAVDPDDILHTPASAVLVILSFSLFLVMASALRFSQTRLFFLLPVLGIAVFLVSLRTLHLRLHGKWAFLQAFLVTLVTLQIASGLHYWPVSPVAYGLVLLGPAYSLTSLLGNLEEGENIRQASIEPVIILILIWGIAIWIG
jgi:Protein of unknown function (DUF5656)